MYKIYLEDLKNNLEDLKDDMLTDGKLLHIEDREIMGDIVNIENSIDRIENLLIKNNCLEGLK
tara:strand:- start:1567 stop:1755 length:189 start_codon:yes stop_codon:yes gene_type:complete